MTPTDGFTRCDVWPPGKALLWRVHPFRHLLALHPLVEDPMLGDRRRTGMRSVALIANPREGWWLARRWALMKDALSSASKVSADARMAGFLSSPMGTWPPLRQKKRMRPCK
ncbi:hypothetical protein LPB72_08700 [Hydrogenophaga crassostreae]|uniref:Uncharacterized protein n=1 Tax=Hydrogenophaga crassostreae TaxID=1763535 RepID=A0A162P7Y2_9BURK|nr:hypothetical protein LPB072_02250 [Hydrogenophaga crassostreae]OAD42291.1 hypothetical protein LPB72_08700 [Hydrogenophaga crassostreae]